MRKENTKHWRMRAFLAVLGLGMALSACGPKGQETPASGQGQETQQGAPFGETSEKTDLAEKTPSGEGAGASEGSGLSLQSGQGGLFRFAATEKIGKQNGLLGERIDFSGYGRLVLQYDGSYRALSEEESGQLKTLFAKLPCVDVQELCLYREDEVWSLRFSLDLDYDAIDIGETDDLTEEEVQRLYAETYLELAEKYPSRYFELVLTEEGYCVISDQGMCCLPTKELMEFMEAFAEIPEQQSGNLTFTTAYEKEPKTEEECRDAAVYCVTKWLEECQKEGTDPQYRNTGFEIAPERKNNFVAGGFVDGRREFLVEVCFTAEYDREQATFYPRHEIAHYTDAGTFWEGGYLEARFCWEDGKVTLLSPNGSSELLNGFQETPYRNFFEYARRSDLEQEIRESFVPYLGVVVSRNLTVTENGKEINLDIYQTGDIEERGEYLFGNPHFRTYRGEEKYYSTGVYFTDGGTSTKDIEYPKSFRLTFDNYTNDGNPDYAVLYDTDEDGAYYVIESVQSDGRVFNHSGRAYTGGVYVAGCFEPSPRLQRTESVPYIGWKKTESGAYVPMATGSYEMELPRLNMYSDRLYLPGTLRLYLEDETAVTCFLWNNTDKEITTQKEYEIQRLDGETWVTLAKGLGTEAQTIAPRQCAEITYDLGILSVRETGRYRVVQKAGTETAYGEFLAQGSEKKAKWEAKMGTETIFEGSVTGVLQLQNLDVQPCRVPQITLQTERGQEVLVQLKYMRSDYVIDGREEISLKFHRPEGFEAGRYVVLADGEEVTSFEVIPGDRRERGIRVACRRDGQTVKVLITNEGTEPVEINEIRILQRKGEDYEATYLMPEDYDALEEEIEPAGSREIVLKNFFLELLDNEDAMKELYEIWTQREEEDFVLYKAYDIPEDATQEVFTQKILEKFMLEEDAPMEAMIEYWYGVQDRMLMMKF